MVDFTSYDMRRHFRMTTDCLQRVMEVLYDARRQLFTQKSQTLENIPPTQAALKQHIKRTCYQTNRWNQAMVLNQEI